MTLLEAAYGAAMTAARPLLPAAGALSPRLARGAAGRRVAAAAIRAWASEARRVGAPLLWLHGASAGELVGAASILDALRREGDGGSGAALQLVVTHTSPSAEGVARALRPDLAAYLPLDAPGEMRAAVGALRPSAVVFAKLDVWPWLTRIAERGGVPLGLVNATVRPGSSRLRAPARWLLRPAYGRLWRVGAVAETDAERLLRLGVRSGALRVTGDAALDRALERAAAAPSGPVIRRLPPPVPGIPRLLGGSTWPPDEEVLLEAAVRLAAKGRPVELILAPHEPTPGAVRRLAARCRERLGSEPRRWSELPAAARRPAPGAGVAAGRAPPPLIVDVTGVLAELYAAADLAWVGGGLARSGLHSVVEPAAAGVPVMFGPRHDRWEAAALLARGGAVQTGAAEAPEAIAALLSNPRSRRRVGREAHAFVRAGAGAGRAGAGLIMELLRASGRPPSAAGPDCTRAGAR